MNKINNKHTHKNIQNNSAMNENIAMRLANELKNKHLKKPL